jgi:two-component system cell cycle sensor histidine kinase PleC
MFGYLRIFVMVSLISVVVIAGMVGVYFRSVGKMDLIAMAEKQNLQQVQSYLEAVWRKSPVSQKQTTTVSAVVLASQQREFEQNSKQFLTQIHALRFNMYDRYGRPIYIHDKNTLLTENIVELLNHMRSSAKVIDSELLKNVASGVAGDDKKHTMLRSIIALDGAAESSAYVETFSDVTSEYQKIIVLQWVATGSIVLVFLILMWILVLTSKRAEEIIARQHESNMELAKKAAVAEAENEQKSLFLANISHELRTPLNAIIGFSEIMKHELSSEAQNERYGSYVIDIHTAGVHLLSLINDILDFSKAEAGKLDLDVSEVNASKMVQNCMRLVSPRAEAANVQLVDGMPKETLIVYSDSKKLKQILLNLLSNAVKFTPTGGYVRVSAWRNLKEDTVSFEVRDSGIGIAAKDISRAMSPFGQVDNTLSRKYEGTGLGLPLTKKLVEVMGGEFKIESEEGKGTFITFTLPIRLKDGDAVQGAAA